MQEIPINTYSSPTVILDLIYRLKVKDVMYKDLTCATMSSTLREIQHLMKKEKITGVPIVQGKRLIGLVSMDDIIQALDKGYIEEPCKAYMSRNIIVLEDDMPISFAINYFDKFSFHRFPVLNKEKELVGMITSRDISATLLVEINREMEILEKSQASNQPTNPNNINGEIHSYNIIKHDFENAGYASTQIKKKLKKGGVATQIIRRAAIASYEMEMNIVVHSNGGQLSATYTPNKVIICAQDRGPGIKDIEKALTPGWSTANDWIRSLGFGAGMGLPNVKNVSDDFSIESSPKGTSVTCTINLQKKDEENKDDSK
ncbi:MAG: CBS domain-containing protein [Sphaerochaetaceae bacterium]|nr:CBS domain-containing protein [Sphaerochaetaceae bacterium]MDC7237866.1 CBS domain-containing protein [Sphaerochaetaceae bacterium]